MIIQEQKEISTLIASSKKVLIATRGNPGFDDIATALAWAHAMKHMHKERVDVVSDIPAAALGRFKFLPGADEIQSRVQSAEHFVIQVDVSKTKVRELSYDLRGSKLEIRVRPEGGNFTEKDISFAQSEFSYDLIVTIGALELAALGGAYDGTRELFFNTPIINLDRQSGNTRFGQVNVVYLKATSLAELTYEILKPSISKDMATCLLTGLIAATNSFQAPQVTPDTLRLASELIVAGAKREEIVTRLYRTKDVNRLKLWGVVLSKLERLDQRVVYAHLRDIGDSDIDLNSLVDELVLASPEAHMALFFVERDAATTDVYCYGRENYDLHAVFQKFNPGGTRRQVSFRLPVSGADAERAVLDYVRQQIKLIE